jgi:hypothetical protein
MRLSHEVLIYIQKVKNFFESDIKVREYFLIDVNEDLFYEKIKEIAQDNYEKNGEPILNTEQFESIRSIFLSIEENKIINNNIEKNYNFFIDHPGYEKICLN